MKKIMIFVFAAGLFSLVNLNSNAQVVVTVRPPEPTVVVAVPPAPSPRHVWVKPYWVWNAHLRRYDRVEGYWALPPHPHAIWIDGHWRERRGGYVWVPGHWGHR
jgi:hypothetical protein